MTYFTAVFKDLPAPQCGWVMTHPRYGKWFMPRTGVIADWKADHAEAYPGEPVPEPTNETIETWLSEQISWIEVAHYGRQLERPDMAAWEAAWLLDMQRNADSPDVRMKRY